MNAVASVYVIIPASNEAGLIGGCLEAVLASDWSLPGSVTAIVVANGCRDDTAGVARALAARFADRGWQLEVIERAEGGKPGALNAGDAAAGPGIRVYLDADVTVSGGLLQALARALDTEKPRYASGRVRIRGSGAVARAYARLWSRVPFMATGVPGCGIFAVNEAGRARWGAFPAIISDDTFVRLHFAPEERIGVDDPYDWPIAEGFGRLVRVRRRQDAGVDEISEHYPELMRNDDDRPFPAQHKAGLAIRDPLGFAVYSGVALGSRLTRGRATGWSRGR